MPISTELNRFENWVVARAGVSSEPITRIVAAAFSGPPPLSSAYKKQPNSRTLKTMSLSTAGQPITPLAPGQPPPSHYVSRDDPQWGRLGSQRWLCRLVAHRQRPQPNLILRLREAPVRLDDVAAGASKSGEGRHGPFESVLTDDGGEA